MMALKQRVETRALLLCALDVHPGGPGHSSAWGNRSPGGEAKPTFPDH